MEGTEFLFHSNKGFTHLANLAVDFMHPTLTGG
jgi:hypothetical protein